LTDTFFKDVVELGKIRISFFVALSALTGYYLYTGHVDLLSAVIYAGVFILSSGSSALNQYQEHEADALMNRTRNRPVPAGRMSDKTALLVSLFLIIAGSLILLLGGNVIAVVMGLLAVLWYNGIYTPLKHRTPFAVVPGSVVGALPPLIGWTAAGGYAFDPGILAVAFFFFIAQIPHFWLILLMLGDDYRKSGMPVLTDVFSVRQVRRITFIWLSATALTGMGLSLYGLISYPFLRFLLQLFSILLLISSSNLLFPPGKRKHKRSAEFLKLNSYVLLIMIILVTDSLL